MKITELSLTNFRNYKKAHFHFSQNTNVFVGKNAKGKTNLIEAIYLLSVSKSFRTRQLSDVVMFNQPFSKITGHLDISHRPYLVEMVVSKEGKKARINGKEINRSSDFVGIFNVVIFTPDDLMLVKGSPKERRRFIDLELSKIDINYLHDLNDYMHFLKQRNAYLKNENIDDTFLSVLTKQLVEVEQRVILKRMSFISRLSQKARQAYSKIASSNELLTIQYDCFCDLEKIEVDHLMHLYDVSKKRDCRFCMTHIGVHKDDLIVLLDGNQASTFASQGQQRTIVLALKIALLELICEEIGEYPVLLLDDVLSELDTSRQNDLLDLIDDRIQTFITTTSMEGLTHTTIQKAKKFEIK